jgi:hypothetical protein
VLPSSSTIYAVAGAALVAGGLWWHGYDTGRDSRAEEIAAISAVGAEQTRRARAVTKEIHDAQQAHLAAWRAARGDAAAAWVQLDRARRGRVPTVCAQSDGAEANRGDGVATVGGEGGGDVLEAVLGALKRGEELEATLELCQAELRQCAGIR